MTVGTKTKREKLAEREEAIISAASEIFHEKGMRAAKMAEIAHEAGIAEGTLYLYFKNKEALFAGVVARHWTSLTAGAQAVVLAHEAPRDQLEALARYTLHRILVDWKLFELSFVVHYASDSDAGDVSDRKGYVRVFDSIVKRGFDRGDFETATPTRYLRDLFFGTMEYAGRSALGSARKPDEDGIVSMLMKAMDGVLRPSKVQNKPDLADRLEAAIDRLEQTTGR